MPMYAYKGFGPNGKTVRGTKEADGLKTLRLALRKEGILVTDAVLASSDSIEANNKTVLERFKKLTQSLEKVSTQEIGMATRQLGTLLNAGVPMVAAFNALIDQVENQKFKRILVNIKADLNEGAALADALQKYPDLFGNIYINMVKAGEKSGTLELVLDRLADFTEAQTKLKSKVISALTYPLVMVGVALLVMVVMLTSVVPSVAQVFKDMNAELPFATRFLIASSNAITHYWWAMLIGFALCVYGFMYWTKTKNGRSKWDSIKLKIPIFGNILRLVAIARFTRTLATLLKSGVPLLGSLQIVRNILSNHVLEVATDMVHDAVKEGEDIASPLKRTGQFPPVVTHMIAIGEKSGQLETMLTRIADSYEQQVDGKVQTLTSLLEPVMILVMGGTVAFMIFAILMPIMEMSNLVQ